MESPVFPLCADSDAVGVLLFTLINANFALEVEMPPSNKSFVVLFSVIVPLVVVSLNGLLVNPVAPEQLIQLGAYVALPPETRHNPLVLVVAVAKSPVTVVPYTTALFPVNDTPESVNPAKVGVAPVFIDCGNESVTPPVLPDAITWFVVPVILVTPLLVKVSDPPSETVPPPVIPVPFAIVILELDNSPLVTFPVLNTPLVLCTTPVPIPETIIFPVLLPPRVSD